MRERRSRVFSFSRVIIACAREQLTRQTTNTSIPYRNYYPYVWHTKLRLNCPLLTFLWSLDSTRYRSPFFSRVDSVYRPSIFTQTISLSNSARELLSALDAITKNVSSQLESKSSDSMRRQNVHKRYAAKYGFRGRSRKPYPFLRYFIEQCLLVTL